MTQSSENSKSATKKQRGWTAQLEHFFFRKEVPYGLAIVRIFLPLAMLIPMMARIPWVRELYSAEGTPVQISRVYGWGNLLPMFSGSVAVTLFLIMIVALLMTSIGWMTRVSVVVGTVLYFYFNSLDSIGTLTKYSVIATDVMVALCLARSGAVWSIDSWLRNRKRRQSGQPLVLNVGRPADRYEIWPRRLVQFLVAACYFGASMTKMHTPEFFSGEQMRFWMLSNVNYHNPVGEYLAMKPVILILAAYATIIWEIMFMFLVWNRTIRLPMILIGIFFHVGTCLTLGLYIFPLICITIYAAFLEDDDVLRVCVWCRNFARRWPRPFEFFSGLATRVSHLAEHVAQTGKNVPAWAVYATMLLALPLVGAELEYRSNHYQITESGGLPLKEIDGQTAHMMIAGAAPLRESDKFHSIDVGTFAISGILANSRREYSHGEVVRIQCHLNPPHEDMWVECNLHDDSGRLIEQNGTIVPREQLHANFYYRMDEAIPPGQYDLVFKSSGIEVGRRRISLEAPLKLPPVETDASDFPPATILGN